MTPEAIQQYLRGPLLTQPILGSYDVVIDYLRSLLVHSPIELMHILYLDRSNRLIHDETLQRGTVDHVPVYPREVARNAILHNASAVLLAHNHPSGNHTPSPSDISMTRTVQKALRTLDITLHDHIIVGNPDTYSFRSEGKL